MAQEDDALRAPIEDWLAAEQLELFDLELLGRGPGRILRVTIDSREEGGSVDVDRLAELSGGLSRLVDTLVDGDFQLEVSSPGLERPLRSPRHYVRSVGREVALKVADGEGTQVVKGKISAADEATVTIESEGLASTFAYESVVSGRTVFRWEPTPKPGKKRKPT